MGSVAKVWKLLERALARFRKGASQPPFVQDYERVFRSLSREELYEEDAPDLDAEISSELFDRRHRDHHFLGTYSEKGGSLAFERYGFFDLLRERGFDPKLSLDVSDPDDHKLRIFDGVRNREHLLIELAASVREAELPNGQACSFLFIGWLLMQDPRREFLPDRPPLPEQEHPGLGLFPHFGYLLKLIAVRVRADGLLNHPSHFHNAVLYGKFSKFADPEIEGRFRALERDLAQLPLAEATRELAEGRVVDPRGRPVRWEPALQVGPITPRAKRWFESDDYLRTSSQVRDECRFGRG